MHSVSRGLVRQRCSSRGSVRAVPHRQRVRQPGADDTLHAVRGGLRQLVDVELVRPLQRGNLFVGGVRIAAHGHVPPVPSWLVQQLCVSGGPGEHGLRAVWGWPVFSRWLQCCERVRAVQSRVRARLLWGRRTVRAVRCGSFLYEPAQRVRVVCSWVVGCARSDGVQPVRSGDRQWHARYSRPVPSVMHCMQCGLVGGCGVQHVRAGAPTGCCFSGSALYRKCERHT